MKLLRLGNVGKEIPAAIDKEGKYRNISSYFKDLNPETINFENHEQLKKINLLLKNIRKFVKFLDDKFDFEQDYPFNEIYLWLEKETCEECIEYVVSIMMEPYNEIIEPL